MKKFFAIALTTAFLGVSLPLTAANAEGTLSTDRQDLRGSWSMADNNTEYSPKHGRIVMKAYQ